MPKPNTIDLPGCDPIPILFEDRSVLAIDKAAGWMLVPVSWQQTGRNLQAALLSAIAVGAFWARSRNLKFLKYVHRLDAETSGVLLFAKSQGALDTIGDLFETRQMEKIYLAVSEQAPKQPAWDCRLALAPDPHKIGRMQPDEAGKDAHTDFRLIASAAGRHLIEARPHTGRQHQIRVHLTATGCPILGDGMYGQATHGEMALRAVGLAYRDPFTKRPVAIRAPVETFLRDCGFPPAAFRVEFQTLPARTPPATAGAAGKKSSTRD